MALGCVLAVGCSGGASTAPSDASGEPTATEIDAFAATVQETQPALRLTTDQARCLATGFAHAVSAERFRELQRDPGFVFAPGAEAAATAQVLKTCTPLANVYRAMLQTRRPPVSESVASCATAALSAFELDALFDGDFTGARGDAYREASAHLGDALSTC